MMNSTEWEILKDSHKFIREEEDPNLNWNDSLAKKYYDSLYKEFVMCDLKHYKSGNFALRWRTEDEVISGAGQSSCANTRCHHSSTTLSTLELPFAYQEHGISKTALVKVVLCQNCVKKLMWKRNKDKNKESE